MALVTVDGEGERCQGHCGHRHEQDVVALPCRLHANPGAVVFRPSRENDFQKSTPRLTFGRPIAALSFTLRRR